MAITTLKTVRLENAGLVDLFAKNKAHFRSIARKAKAYAGQYINTADIHHDDLIPYMITPLELDKTLREHMERKKLPQNRITWFGEYIVDEVWGEI
jgi:hypothetical protein